MKEQDNNIHPVFDWILTRKHKEELLQQHAIAIWMTGLSGAGKSTIASGVERKLFELGFLTQIIDGDNVRSGINKNLSFTEADRKENLRRIAEVNKLFLNCGVITINSFISPTDETREMAKEIIGKESFFEVYINSPLSVCEKRDTKGLYKKARSGELKNFTGIDSPFDAPKKPDLEIDTDKLSVDESVELLLNFIIPRIQKERD
jgi:adenylylsulfate kinase